MESFGKLVGSLLCAIPVIGAVAATIFAIQIVIAFFPVILGLAVLLFLGYALCVGLDRIGSGNVK